jgi:hypothetical protein
MHYSYNGWPASSDRSDIGVEPFYYRGKPFPAGVKSGDVAVVFSYLVAQLDNRVEPFGNGFGCWGHNFRLNRNANNISCHGSGTAIDWRAPDHPNGVSGTFTPAQFREIKKILLELESVVRQLIGYDEMHFEIKGSAADVKRVADKIRNGTIGAATHTNRSDKMDQADREWVKAELNTSEGQIAAAFRREIDELRLTITGGVRKRDKNGRVLDEDPENISIADTFTRIEDNQKALDAKLNAILAKL